jgi:hypothetical protein
MTAMALIPAEANWTERALSGSPDFLQDIRTGAVTWNQLWEFYGRRPAQTAAMLALMGFFHAVQSRRYEREGSVLDRDGRVYPELREWARFVVANEGVVPEQKLRDSLAGLLGLSLISSLYYELVFNLYLEAMLERHGARWTSEVSRLEPAQAAAVTRSPGRLAVQLPDGVGSSAGASLAGPAAVFSLAVARHYDSWNEAFQLALGDPNDERFDDGGES